MNAALEPALRGRTHVLLDFDGPVCSVFAGLSAAEVADRMRQRLRDAGQSITPEWEEENDPLALLSRISRALPGLAEQADAVLTELETDAARLARANPDIKPVLDACVGTGRTVLVVSNNSGQAIDLYLRREGLTGQVERVVGRVPGEPASMKPSPRLLLDAMGETVAARCVFIGDAVRDVEAGHAAGVPTIGYANKPGKAAKLTAAGAVAVVESLLPLADALTSIDSHL
ncbi:HAD family hydrolase [Streptomyces radicis]|uniref:HAD family hydrolase n=1 Tax=Streptomyces radicis TaxID=1750517 RepID=A0A3A9W2A1_9ACTN|nr:HAD hydrolase-like protein [Streptomyces radicis]RKN07278.1 HAD family hydrolase [Streptomyces radicis]RKN26705.1 HAD family hydrolase [Streptomyces radicis]